MPRVRLTRSGHITVPKRIRDAKNWKKGTIIEIEDRRGALFLRVAETQTSEQDAEADQSSADVIEQARRR